jgi:hypothetical protein
MSVMARLRDFMRREGESLADRIGRLAVVFQSASPAVKERYRTEILDWMMQPEVEALGTGLVGKLGINDGARTIFDRLSSKSIPAYDASRCIIALGQLFYEPAANTIEAHYLTGRTKAAATVALHLIDPERVRYVFEDYAAKNPDEGSALAGTGMLEYFERRRLQGIKLRAEVLPADLRKNIPRLFDLPGELDDFLQTYTRRT